MTRPIAVTLVLFLSASLSACASARTSDGESSGAAPAPPEVPPAQAADEPKWEPWPPPETPRPAPPQPSGPTIRLAPKDGGWSMQDLLTEVTRVTGRPILYDGTNATFKQAKVEFIAANGLEMPASDVFPFIQAVLSYRKLVLVPVGPKLGNGEQAWFVMDQADPNLKSRPVYLDESEVLNYAERDGLYVVTTLRLRDTVDAVRARNALSPISTATAGIGRIQDNGGRFLIVGDFAPVVAAMKRLLDRINDSTPPSAVRPAPPPPKPAEK